MGRLLMALAALGVSACAQAAPDQSANTTQPKAAAPAPAAPAAARGVDDPRAFVAATYAAYRASNNATPDVDYAYSPRLVALFRDYAAAQSPDEVGSLDFDWWVNGQDWEISEPVLAETNEGPRPPPDHRPLHQLGDGRDHPLRLRPRERPLVSRRRPGRERRRGLDLIGAAARAAVNGRMGTVTSNCPP